MFLQVLVAFEACIAGQARLSAAQTIDPHSVSPIIRDGWCTSQENVCSTLCGGSTRLNTCILSNFVVECQCDGTFLQPDYELYKGSLAYFICEEYIRQCVAGNSSNSENQAECRSAYTCPSLDLSAAVQTSDSPGVSQTLSPSPSPTPSPTLSPSSRLPTTGSGEPSESSDSLTTVEQHSSTHTTTTPGQSTDTAIPTDDVDRPLSTESSSPTSNPDSPLDPPTTGSKGLGTPAIAGIAVGVGVPVLLLALFLAYRLGTRRIYPPVPVVPHSAFDKEYGGNEYPGGGNDPGIGFGNEVGGIVRNNYSTTRT
ncbi:uncharacterized protein DFL_008342 [Arthrobotrys flagrans]|uniref:DUF7707 domain-containing protein n=1 Tax=Arthrobotrys flagrans TaxID=97331 RepID=A0A436ZNK1_ARTFL|nr:hypothetical protein DFL_008342 [Arthrobotrys flagrans]